MVVVELRMTCGKYSTEMEIDAVLGLESFCQLDEIDLGAGFMKPGLIDQEAGLGRGGCCKRQRTERENKDCMS